MNEGLDWKIDISVFSYDEEDEGILYSLSLNPPTIIGFSCYIWNITRTLQLVRKIKLILPNIVIVLGGPEVSDYEQTLLENPEVDAVSFGEGEITFYNILAALGNEASLIGIPGLAVRSSPGRVSFQSCDANLVNMDEIPSIVDDPLCSAYHLALYETSRGCPFSCNYCLWGGAKVRYRSLPRVFSDLKKILKNPKISRLFVIDSELDIDVSRAKEILNYIASENDRRIPVSIFLGLHHMDEELLLLAKKAHAIFGIGIQAVNKETCRIIGRSWFNPERFSEKLKVLKKYFDPREIELQFILGLPGDNYERFRETVLWCLSSGFRITANRLYLLPGTNFYKRADELGIVYDKRPFHLVYATATFPYDEIARAEALLYAAFQLDNLGMANVNEILGVLRIPLGHLINAAESAVIDSGSWFSKRQENSFKNVISASRQRKILAGTINKIVSNRSERSKFRNLVLFRMNIATITHSFSQSVHISRGGEKPNNSNDIFQISCFAIAPCVKINASVVTAKQGRRVVILPEYEGKKLCFVEVSKVLVRDLRKLLNALVIGVPTDTIHDFISSFEHSEAISAVFSAMVRGGMVMGGEKGVLE